MIEINIDETIFRIIQNNPLVKEIMVETGFENITKPGMLQSVGKVMTIRKGAIMKGIDWDRIEKIFKEHGYILIGGSK